MWSQSTQSPKPKKQRWSMNIIGYVLWLYAILLVGCGSFLARDQADNQVADSPSSSQNETSVLEMSPAEPTATFTPVPGMTVEPDANAADTAGTEATQTSLGDSISPGGDNLSVASQPEIGEITFALDVSEAYEPIGPGFLFTKGITEVHAIFDYSGMSTEYTWERVWYLNDKEISRTASAWTGPESGVFDYFIDNGGKPLPAGDWILELYVEGELHSLGVFIVE